MRAHQADLRDEVARERRSPGGGPDPAAFAADIAAQGSEAAPTPRLRAILRHAERLALQPAGVTAAHVEELRAHGLDDRAVSDLTQVAAYFAYINRIADGLGVDPEPDPS